VAEILLKRTTAKAASRVYEEFLTLYPSIEDLSQVKLERLESILKPVGYSKLRSKELKAISAFIVTKYGGRIPSTIDELDAIPFIGPYTAGAVMCFGYDSCAPMVDSNVERIIGRVFMGSFKKKPNNKIAFHVVSQLVPQVAYKKFNLALLDLGALICTPKNPKCRRCPLLGVCDYGMANQTET
jgi:A/G-specific adenine glycosylase